MINIPETLRLELKEKRKENGLSYTQAATLIQVDAATLRRWENGTIKTTTPQHFRMLQLFLIPKHASLPSELQSILNLYDALCPDYQQKLLKEISLSLTRLLTDSTNHSPIQ